MSQKVEALKSAALMGAAFTFWELLDSLAVAEWINYGLYWLFWSALMYALLRWSQRVQARKTDASLSGDVVEGSESGSVSK